MIPALLSTLVFALGADGPPEAPPEMPDPTRFSILELQGKYEQARAAYGARWALTRMAWLWMACGQPDQSWLWTAGKDRIRTEEERSLVGLFALDPYCIGDTKFEPFVYAEGLFLVDRWPGQTRPAEPCVLVWRPGYASVDWPGPPEEIRQAPPSCHPRIGFMWEDVSHCFPVLCRNRPVRRFRLWHSGWKEMGCPEERDVFAFAHGTLRFQHWGPFADQVRRWSARWGVKCSLSRPVRVP